MVKVKKALSKPNEKLERSSKNLITPPLAGVLKKKVSKPKQEKMPKEAIKDIEFIKPEKSASTKKLHKEAQKSKKQPQRKLARKPLVLAPPKSPPATGTLKKKVLSKKAKIPKLITNTKQPEKPLTNLQKKKSVKRAFKKQQLKKKRAGVIKKSKKTKSRRVFKAPPFDEDKFNAIVNEDNIKTIVGALKTQVEKEVERKKTTIFSDFHYFLNVSCFKIPNVPKRIIKLNLKHSLVDKDDDVAIIVADLQRGAKIDYEPTIQHYEDLFRQAGIEGLKIIPFNKLRTECNTFESIRKFGNTYDYFMCDGRLLGHVTGFCGKIFQKPRTTFHGVRLDNPNNLKREIEKSLHRTAYKQIEKGDLISIMVGNHKNTEIQLADNIMHVMEQLKSTYPGGLSNIRGIYVKIGITGTSALPIYLSVAEAPAEAPYIVGPRERRMLKLKREANAVLEQFSMTKEGHLLKLPKTVVQRKRKLKEMRATLEASDGETEKDDVRTKKTKTESKEGAGIKAEKKRESMKKLGQKSSGR